MGVFLQKMTLHCHASKHFNSVYPFLKCCLYFVNRLTSYFVNVRIEYKISPRHTLDFQVYSTVLEHGGDAEFDAMLEVFKHTNRLKICFHWEACIWNVREFCNV